MNRTILIIAVIIFIAILGITFSIFYFSVQNDQTPGTQERRSFFETVFPFGSSPDERSLAEDETRDEINNETTGQTAPTLRLITGKPVSGLVVTTTEQGGEDVEVIRYVDRETGHFIETETATLRKSPLSNTTIPRVQEALWSPDGERVILRFFNSNQDIESFSAIVPDTPSDSVDGSFLDVNIPYITTFEDEIGYTFLDEAGTTFVRSNYQGSARREVFFSELKELAISWGQPTRIVFSSKPSASYAGLTFSVTTGNQVVTLIEEDRLALSSLLHPATDQVLQSYLDEEGIYNLSVYDSSNQSTLLPLIGTFVEKCTWSTEDDDKIYCAKPKFFRSGSIVPDDWYKGTLSLSDEIWEIDTETQDTRLVIDLEADAREPIDAINLHVSPSGEYLVFMNKRDLSLWSLRIPEEEERGD